VQDNGKSYIPCTHCLKAIQLLHKIPFYKEFLYINSRFNNAHGQLLRPHKGLFKVIASIKKLALYKQDTHLIAR